MKVGFRQYLRWTLHSTIRRLPIELETQLSEYLVPTNFTLSTRIENNCSQLSAILFITLLCRKKLGNNLCNIHIGNFYNRYIRSKVI